MSGVEAAASLFGSDSSESDLFASIGGDPPAEPSPAAPDNDKALDFGASSQYPDFYTETPAQPTTTASEYPEYSRGQSQQPQTYAPLDPYAVDPYKAQTSAPSNATSYPSAAYSYAPQQPSYAYSPAPAVPTPSVYTPAAPQTTYSPYAPATNAYPSYSVPAPAASYATVPKPPVPTVPAVLNRPKVSNAYDPPFIPQPTRKTSRQVVAQTSYVPRQQSPFTVEHPSSNYGPPPPAAHQPPPPPPPRAHAESPGYDGQQYGPHGVQHRSTAPPQPPAHDAYTAPFHTRSPPIPAPVQRDYQLPVADAPWTETDQAFDPETLLEQQRTVSPPVRTESRDPYAPSSHSQSPYTAPPRTESPYAPTSQTRSPYAPPPQTQSTYAPPPQSQSPYAPPPQSQPSYAPPPSQPSYPAPPQASPYAPPSQAATRSPEAPTHQLKDIQERSAIDASSPYAPPPTNATSPPPVPRPSSRSTGRGSPSPYSPPQRHAKGPSNGSVVSVQREGSLGSSYDPYAPKNPHSYTNFIPRTSSPLSHMADRPKPVPTNGSALGSPPQVPAGMTSPYQPYQPPSMPTDEYKRPRQEMKLVPHDYSRPEATQYAPSPSLLGSNDPLARTSARAPVITFGFGGKMVTCFHGMPGLNAGFDVAFSSRTSSQLKIRVLHKIIPAAALPIPPSNYPGPLTSDPGTPALSLVRSNAGRAEAKKTGVIAYLSGRADEIRQGLPYLSSKERQAAEGKLVLVSLLKVMVENDGKLLGTPQLDLATRTALVPRLEAPLTLTDGMLPGQGYTQFGANDSDVSVTTVKSSSLDMIEELLLRGERRKALQCAMDDKLWAHAMVIASSVDKDAWKDVVNDFLRSEFPVNQHHGAATNGSAQPSGFKGRESLRVAYSLFSGQGAAAIQELAPVSLLQRTTRTVPLPAPTAPIPAPVGSVTTPRTPQFPGPVQQGVPAESLSKWAETAAMMISSPLTAEVSAALTALGDQLLANQMIEAAHACYLLSPQTSPIGGAGPASRVTLLGCINPRDVAKDVDILCFTEILEFALTLVPTTKGQESFHCLPHLQAYRLFRANCFAEVGHNQLASRYCEAITATLPQNSPYTNPILVQKLQGLSQRLSGTHTDKSSWIGSKLSKPSLDTVGGWFESKLTKLVTGESDSITPVAEEKKTSDGAQAGPFAHFSNISHAPSARSSPQPILPPMPHTAVTATFPPMRTASAADLTSPYAVPPERSASAAAYTRPRPPVQARGVHQVSSSQSSPASSFVDRAYESEGSGSPLAEENEASMRGTSWWDSSASVQTPTATSFYQVDSSAVSSTSNGFISLMDQQPTIGPSTTHSSSQRTSLDLDDDDDLGLGNSKSRAKAEAREEEEKEAAPKKEEAKPQQLPEQKPSAAKSWFSISRLWSGSGEQPSGPIKASLGEESSFYYDKDLKKWVNKNAPPEEKKAAAPPPPPPARAQTASPGSAAGIRPPPLSASAPPRPSSAIDLSTEPPTMHARMRSNLAPPDAEPPIAPPGAGSRLSPAPPPSRPRSSAAKRNIRNRYVDVFQQEGNASS